MRTGRMRAAMVVSAGLVLALGLAGTGWAKEKAVELKWKVGEGKAVGFRVNMSPVEAGKEGAKIDVDGLAAKAKEKGDDVPDMKAFGEVKMPTQATMSTVLKGLGQGNISVKAIMGKVAMPETGAGVEETEQAAAMRKAMEALEGTVQLRGEIDEHGKVRSFYLEGAQKNLLALLFQLPEGAVKPGDVWSVDASLITLGTGFINEKSVQVNRVKLVRLEKTAEGQTVAVMDYYVVERVKGKVEPPKGAAGMGETGGPLEMTAAFMGRGEFLVEKGQWKRLSGRMRIKATGMMNADTNQEMILEPMNEVPAEMMKVE